MASGTAYPTQLEREALHVPASHKFKLRKLRKYTPVRVHHNTKDASPGGFFDKLPLEIMHEIFWHADPDAIGMFRAASKTTQTLAASFSAYWLLRQHAKHTLQVMHITKCISYFSIDSLYHEFCQPRCRTCADFGPFLYLPTLSRCCFQCSILRLEYRVAPTPDVMFNFGIGLKDLKTIPIIYPESAPPWDHPLRPVNEQFRDRMRKQRMVDVAQARAVALKLHGNEKEMQRAFHSRQKNREKQQQDAWKLYYSHEWPPERERAPKFREIPTDLLHSLQAKEWRNLGTTVFPYWDSKKAKLERGVYCQACKQEYSEAQQITSSAYLQPAVKREYDRAFLLTDLPAHFAKCLTNKKRESSKNLEKGPSLWSYSYPRPGNEIRVNAKGVIVRGKVKHEIIMID